MRRHLNGRDPIGMRLDVQSMDMKGGPTPVTREIVGVSRQVAEQAGEKERAVEIYVPIAQNPWFSASLAVQTAGDPMALLPAVKAAIARVDKDQPLTRVRTMEEVAAEATSQPRFRAELVGVFAVLALVLAAVGIFGVLAFSVGQRAREFGIRVALGARSHDVLRLVLGGALKMTGAGVAIGLVAAALLTRLLGTLLFARAAAPIRSRSSAPRPCSAPPRSSPARCPPGARRASIRLSHCAGTRRTAETARSLRKFSLRSLRSPRFLLDVVQAPSWRARSLKSVAETSATPSAFRSGLPSGPYSFGLTTNAVRRPTCFAARRSPRCAATIITSAGFRSRMSAADW